MYIIDSLIRIFRIGKTILSSFVYPFIFLFSHHIFKCLFRLMKTIQKHTPHICLCLVWRGSCVCCFFFQYVFANIFIGPVKLKLIDAFVWHAHSLGIGIRTWYTMIYKVMHLMHYETKKSSLFISLYKCCWLVHCLANSFLSMTVQYCLLSGIIDTFFQ